MTVHIGEGIRADGTPNELGLFTAVYVASLATMRGTMKAKMEADALIARLSKQIKGIDVQKIEKKEAENDGHEKPGISGKGTPEKDMPDMR